MSRRTPGEATTPGGAPVRFPGLDVLESTGSWDAVTAGVVLRRVGPLPPVRFFTMEQEAVARPLLDLILDQHEEPRVPVFEMVDQRLAELSTDGWHYEDLPPDPEAWARSLEALTGDASVRFGRPYARCGDEERATLLEDLLDLGGRAWHGMRADRVWSLWSRYACTAFYSHPWAWNEIGFPGPAYPRGYKNPGINSLEPREVPDADPRRHAEGPSS